MNRELDSFTRHCPLLLFGHVVCLAPYVRTEHVIFNDLRSRW